MRRKLEGKIGVVRGRTSGSGPATAWQFAAGGARVAVAVATIGPDAAGFRADSADMDAFADLHAQVDAAAGRTDVHFVNAGGSLRPLVSIAEAQHEDTSGRNVKGVLFTVQKVLLLLADEASAIWTGSTAAAGGNPGCVFLALEDASFVTGAGLFASGGEAQA